MVVVEDVAVVDDVVVGPPEPTTKVPIMESACGSQRNSYVPRSPNTLTRVRTSVSERDRGPSRRPAPQWGAGAGYPVAVEFGSDSGAVLGGVRWR